MDSEAFVLPAFSAGEWRRPADIGRVHFSCDGSLLLLRGVRDQARSGDTASATPLGGTRPWVFEFRAEGWMPLEPWSVDALPRYVMSAALLVVLVDWSKAKVAALGKRRAQA